MSATETFPTHHMFLDYPIGNLPGWLVPQEWYTPATSKTDIDIKHYLPVQFFDSLYELGMPLTQFSETDTDVPRTPTPKNTVSRGTDETETEIHHVHILWPGYEPWSTEIDFPLCKPSLNGDSNNNNDELARAVMCCIARFFSAHSTTKSSEDCPDWWLSSTQLSDLLLVSVEVRHVAVAPEDGRKHWHWQPVLCRAVQRILTCAQADVIRALRDVEPFYVGDDSWKDGRSAVACSTV